MLFRMNPIAETAQVRRVLAWQAVPCVRGRLICQYCRFLWTRGVLRRSGVRCAAIVKIYHIILRQIVMLYIIPPGCVELQFYC